MSLSGVSFNIGVPLGGCCRYVKFYVLTGNWIMASIDELSVQADGDVDHGNLQSPLQAVR